MSDFKRGTGWYVEEYSRMTAIYPVDDLIAHEPTNFDCICGPIRRKNADRYILQHPSLDGREFHE